MTRTLFILFFSFALISCGAHRPISIQKQENVSPELTTPAPNSELFIAGGCTIQATTGNPGNMQISLAAGVPEYRLRISAANGASISSAYSASETSFSWVLTPTTIGLVGHAQLMPGGGTGGARITIVTNVAAAGGYLGCDYRPN